jgi:hypothetical protein
MLTRPRVVIESVEPLQGKEGTVVTLRGSGFAKHPRNNCVVVGGMGACARPVKEATDNELQVRIGPVSKRTHGDILMWPGIGMDLHTERLTSDRATLAFSEASIFRNAAPVASAGVDFQLTDASSGAYAGTFEERSTEQLDLGGHEQGAVMRVAFPANLSVDKGASVDICVVLKEPTLAIDFTADVSGRI